MSEGGTLLCFRVLYTAIVVCSRHSNMEPHVLQREAYDTITYINTLYRGLISWHLYAGVVYSAPSSSSDEYFMVGIIRGSCASSTEKVVSTR